jgi:hypothetical protein
MSKLHMELREKSERHLADDGRCDSAGHSATYGTYTCSMMDCDSFKIVARNLVKVIFLRFESSQYGVN